MKKPIQVLAILLILGVGAVIGSTVLQVFADWTAPLHTPPTCLTGEPGCDAPINVGPNPQSKPSGLLGIGNLMVTKLFSSEANNTGKGDIGMILTTIDNIGTVGWRTPTGTGGVTTKPDIWIGVTQTTGARAMCIAADRKYVAGPCKGITTGPTYIDTIYYPKGTPYDGTVWESPTDGRISCAESGVSYKQNADTNTQILCTNNPPPTSATAGMRKGPAGCNNIITYSTTCRSIATEGCTGSGCVSQYLKCDGTGGIDGFPLTCDTTPI